MLDILKHILHPKIFDAVAEWMPPPVVINSFDCARFSMGVTQVDVDTVTIVPAVRLHGTVADRVAQLERYVAHLAQAIDNIIRVRYLGVWQLGRNDAEVHDAWQIAPPLRDRLEKMDRKFGAPDVLIYEFQMGPNDKSRTVSSMLAYHYCARADRNTRTVRIQPAVKNTLCLGRSITRASFEQRCPRVSGRRIKNIVTGRMTTVAALIFQTADRCDLSIQTFLALVDDTYRANKLHTSANLEWWASAFAVDLKHVPADCLDDAADAFMQMLGALRRRMI